MNFRPYVRPLRRCYSQKPTTGVIKPQAPKLAEAGVNANVPGLSNRCIKPLTGENVGPGASATAEYKVPEYFLYDKMSFAEAEIEMSKYRCPQPSALKK